MSESAATSSPAKRSARRKPASHPKYSEMVRKAMESENGRAGCSRQSIQKYIKKNFTVGDQSDLQTKITLKRMVANGDLLHIKGIGASGSFALPRVKKDTSKPKIVKPKITPKFRASKLKVSPQKKTKQARKKSTATKTTKSPKPVAKKEKASKALKSKTIKKTPQKATKPKAKPKPKATPKPKAKAKPKAKPKPIKKSPGKKATKKK